MKKNVVFFLILITGISYASDRLDNWSDIMLSVGSSSQPGGKLEADSEAKVFSRDHSCKQNGAFSIMFNSNINPDVRSIGFVSGRFTPLWRIDNDMVLSMAIMVETPDLPEVITAEIYDANGNKCAVSAELENKSEWQRIEFTFKDNSGIDLNKLSMCSFSQPFITKARIWFDDVYFYGPSSGRYVGITEKTLRQHIADARSTRKERTDYLLTQYSTEGLREAFKELLFKLIDGKDVDEVNKEFLRIITSEDKQLRDQYRLSDHWCLVTNQLLYRIYYMFGSEGSVDPGRITPELEKAILDELWNRTYHKNDINLAKQSTWWLIGSENHDIISKVSSLLASQIFMNEPEYAARIYPDLGDGGASGYWFHSKNVDKDGVIGPPGRESKGPLNKYNSKEHYRAWVKFWKEYLSERVRRGFFVETAACGYMSVTISHIMDIADLCEDRELKEQAKDFLDLVWYQWAQDSISGVRGGSKTRSIDGFHWKDSMYSFSTFEFGGLAPNLAGNLWVMLVTDYRIPEGVWRMELDRQSLGDFAYISRKPGEEQNVWPRPLGLERTLMCDTESRFVRYSWVTPDYVLGSQMDHPASVHSHLSVAMRWQGMIFHGDEGARVFPMRVLWNEEQQDWVPSRGQYMRNAQSKNVMITQQCRRWLQQNPDWFPCVDMIGYDIGIYFGTNLDEMLEKEGWIFVGEENAYLAVRIIQSDRHEKFKVGRDETGTSLTASLIEESYEWNKAHTLVKMNDKYSAVIFEAASKDDFKSIDDFAASILDNELTIGKTVVPGWITVTYRPDNGDEIYFNAANNELPRINGQAVDYAPKKTFDSPFISGMYGKPSVNIYYNDKKQKTIKID